MQRLRIIASTLGVAFALLLVLWAAPMITRGATLRVGPNQTYTTIQAAINAARDGDTILVRSGTYNISAPLFITKSLVIKGGYNANFVESQRQYGASKISGNRSIPGVVIGDEAVFSGLSANAFVPPIDPKAFHVVFDGFTVQSSEIGILAGIPAEGKLQVLNGTIYNNGVVTGTGIGIGGGMLAFIDNRASLLITSTEVMSNIAPIGGGIAVFNGMPAFAEGQDGASFSDRLNPKVVFEDLFVHENVAVTCSTGCTPYSGTAAGLFVDLSNYADVQMTRVLLQDNRSEDNSAGLYLNLRNHSKLSMVDTSFERNLAEGDYAAGWLVLGNDVQANFVRTYLGYNATLYGSSGLHLDADQNVQVTSDSFVAEKNTGAGPALFFYMEDNSSITVTQGITLTENWISNTEGLNGINGSAGLNFTGYRNASLDVNRIYAYDNRCTACSGGAAAFLANYNSQVTIGETEAISNTALMPGGPVSAGNGGAFYVNTWYGSTFALNGGTFAKNRALGQGDTGMGGAIYFYGDEDGVASQGSSHTISNVDFYSNTASYAGGAVYKQETTASNIVITNNTFEDNAAKYGGGFYQRGNLAEDPNAGPLFANNQFVHNYADSDGGGAYFSDDAAYYGGAEDNALQFVDNTFERNIANVGSGGGASFSSGLVFGGAAVFSRNVFTGNVTLVAEEGDGGGGLFIGNDMLGVGGRVDFADNVFMNNRSAGMGGGLGFGEDIVDDGGVANFTNNVFAGNRATYNGGGIGVVETLYDDGGWFNFVGNQVVDNISVENGAGIWVNETLENGKGYFANNIISRNTITGGVGFGPSSTGFDGAGVFFGNGLIDGAWLLFESNIITGNMATGAGGGVMFDDDTRMIEAGSYVGFHDNVLSNNMAEKEGGACAVYTYVSDGSELEFERNTFANNVSNYAGGACYVGTLEYGGQVDFADNTFTGNQSLLAGGALAFLGFGYDNVQLNGLVEIAADNGGGVLNVERNTLTGNRTGYLGTYPNGEAFGGIGGAIAIGGMGQGPGAATGGYGAHTINISGNTIDGNRAYTGTGALKSDVSGQATLPELAAGRAGAIGIVAPQDVLYISPNSVDAQTVANTEIILNDNLIQNNKADGEFAGVVIEMSVGSLHAEDNQFLNNEAKGAGGALTLATVPYNGSIQLLDTTVYTYPSNVQAAVIGNIFQGNKASQGGSLWLYNNAGIMSGAAREASQLYAYTLNNLFARNSHGVWVQDFPYYSRNDTIAYNLSHGVRITATVNSAASMNMLNSILWGNAGQIREYGAAVDVTVDYSIIEGGNDSGDNNLSVDPQFVNVAANNFQLKATSPAVNYAFPGNATVCDGRTPYSSTCEVPDDDVVDLFRPVAGGYDIGAYEWRIAEVTGTLTSNNLVEVPGTAGASTLNVKNGSNFEDTFIVSLVLNSLNWPVTFDLATLANGPYQITVPQGGTVPFDVSVDVPADAQGGDETHLRFLIQSQRTPGLVDTVDMYVAADNIAGVALTPNRTGSTAPGTVIGYEHTLTNNGNFADTINLAAVSSKGWPVLVTPSIKTLAAGASATVHISVTVPAGTGGASDVTTLTATSSSDLGTTTASATASTTVPQVAGVFLSPGQAKNAYAGDTVTYSHIVTNTGNGPDTFNLTYVSTNGWTVTGPATVTVAAGSSKLIVVSVVVPAGAADSSDTLTIRAASKFNGAFQAISQDTTIARLPDWMPFGGVALSIGTAKAAPAGTTVLYTHWITNTGATIDTFNLTYVSSNGWLVQGLAQVTLFPGSSQQLSIIVNVPANAAGKVDVMTVKAVSTVNSSFSMSAQDTTVVSNPAVSISIGTAKGALPGTTVPFSHLVENIGAIQATYDISYVSVNGWSVVGETELTLAPGAARMIDFVVSVPAGASGLVDVITIYVTPRENTYAGATAQDTIVVGTPKFGLSEGTSKTAMPGDTVRYTHRVTNDFNGPDTIILTYESANGWPVNGPATVALAGGASADIVVDVATPLGSFGINDVLTIRAKSSVDNSVTTFVQNTTVVNTIGFELRENRTGVVGLETKVFYTHTLVNTGTAPDTYYLTYASSAGWDIKAPTSVSLQGGETATIVVELTTPTVDEVQTSQDVTEITATSALDSDLKATVVDTTNLIRTRLWLPAIQAWKDTK